MASTILQQYVEVLGWNILPLNGKQPVVAWEEMQNRKPKEPLSMFRRGNNVGLVMGHTSNVLVIDVDPRNLPSTLTTDEVVKHIKNTLGVTVYSETGGGGYHFFYSYAGSEYLHTQEVIDGVEVKSLGSQVVLPPSKHPETKQPYKWMVSPFEAQLKPIPPKRWENFYSYLDTFNPSKNGDGDDHWLTEVLQGVGEGYRDNSAIKLAGYFVSKGIPPDVMEMMLHNWNTQNKPPLAYTDIVRIAQQAAKMSSGDDLIEIIFDDAGQPDYTNTAVAMGFTSINATEVETKSEEWMVGGWIPSKAVCMMAGEPATYKSWLAMALGVSVTSGRPFLGEYQVLERGNVVYLQMEDNYNMTVRRFVMIEYSDQEKRWQREVTVDPDTDTIRVKPHKEPEYKLWIPPDDHRPAFLAPQTKEDFVAMIKTIQQLFGAKLIILDTLSSFGLSDDEYYQDLAGAFEECRRLCAQHDFSLLVLHHLRKVGNKDAKTLDGVFDRFFGSAFLRAKVQARIGIINKGNRKIELRIETKQGQAGGDMMIQFNFKSGYQSDPPRFGITRTIAEEVTDAITGDKPHPDDKRGNILYCLRQGEKTLAEITEHTKYNRSTIHHHLTNLQKDGHVVTIPDKKPALYRLSGGGDMFVNIEGV